MPRILHVTTVSPTLWFLHGLLRHARRHGFWAGVLSSPDEMLEQFSRTHDVPCFAVQMERRISPLRDLGSLLRLVQTLRRVRPDIVHAHTPKAGLLGMIAGRLTGAPVCIYHLLGLRLETARGLQRRILQLAERLACALAHEVLCVSGSLRELAIAEGIVPVGKIHVLARGTITGVDAQRRFNPANFAGVREAMRAELGIPAGATVVGFLGRIVRDKGIVELAQAWAQLREQWPEAHLLLVGRCEEEDPVTPEVLERLRADPRVRVPGFVDDVAHAYTAMDLLVLPSYREGFPNVPLEAAAMGLPVVTTRATGCIEAVRPGVTGQLVPVRDAQALRTALALYLGEPALRSAHGAAGREWVMREFQPEQVWEATLDTYRRLLARAGVPLPMRPASEDTSSKDRLVSNG